MSEATASLVATITVYKNHLILSWTDEFRKLCVTDTDAALEKIMPVGNSEKYGCQVGTTILNTKDNLGISPEALEFLKETAQNKSLDAIAGFMFNKDRFAVLTHPENPLPNLAIIKSDIEHSKYGYEEPDHVVIENISPDAAIRYIDSNYLINANDSQKEQENKDKFVEEVEAKIIEMILGDEKEVGKE